MSKTESSRSGSVDGSYSSSMPAERSASGVVLRRTFPGLLLMGGQPEAVSLAGRSLLLGADEFGHFLVHRQGEQLGEPVLLRGSKEPIKHRNENVFLVNGSVAK